jgi:hypothetical protein
VFGGCGHSTGLSHGALVSHVNAICTLDREHIAAAEVAQKPLGQSSARQLLQKKLASAEQALTELQRLSATGADRGPFTSYVHAVSNEVSVGRRFSDASTQAEVEPALRPLNAIHYRETELEDRLGLTACPRTGR